MPVDTHGQREQGIDVQQLRDALRDCTYPATGDEIADACRGASFALDGETGQTATDLFGPAADHTFASAEGAYEWLLSVVDSEAVGHQRYTDRGTAAPEMGTRYTP